MSFTDWKNITSDPKSRQKPRGGARCWGADRPEWSNRTMTPEPFGLLARPGRVIERRDQPAELGWMDRVSEELNHARDGSARAAEETMTMYGEPNSVLLATSRPRSMRWPQNTSWNRPTPPSTASGSHRATKTNKDLLDVKLSQEGRVRVLQHQPVHPAVADRGQRQRQGQPAVLRRRAQREHPRRVHPLRVRGAGPATRRVGGDSHGAKIR